MNRYTLPTIGVLFLCAAALLSGTLGVTAQEPPRPGYAVPLPAPPLPALPLPQGDQAEPGVEIQTRGPIHEAYASPIEARPEPGELVAKEPPPPVPEEPPGEAPAGANVQWVSGYWSWDAERNEFVWVSGVHRDAPEGRRYVSGYWVQDGAGWRRVNGFWASDRQADLPYQPQPPESLDRGPSLPPPGEDYQYTPGTWVYRDTRFVWTPGYWFRMNTGCVWTPPHYVWTPAGYLYVSGYCDYPLEQRGCLYAPVVFTRPLWRDPNWCFRPRYVVPCDPLHETLFVGPGRRYFYGNYFGGAGRGFSFWASVGSRQYDPLYSYYRTANRGNPGWARNLQSNYNERVAGRLARPPETFAQQGAPGQRFRMAALASQLQQERKLNLTALAAPQVQAQNTHAKEMREAGATRARLEHQLRQTPRVANQPALTLPVDRLSIAPRNTGAGQPQFNKKPGTAEPPRFAPSTPRAELPRLEPRKDLPRQEQPRLGSPGNPTAPKLNPPKLDGQPRSFTPPPKLDGQPRSFTPPPKVDGQPRNFTPPPKVDGQPRNFTPPPKVDGQPRNFTPPPRVNAPPPKDNNPAPRVNAPPRSFTPAPKVNNPAPKLNIASPPPRTEAPRAQPRNVTPSPKKDAPPRTSAPSPRSAPSSSDKGQKKTSAAPAPKASAAPVVRQAPRPAPQARSAPRTAPASGAVSTAPNGKSGSAKKGRDKK